MGCCPCGTANPPCGNCGVSSTGRFQCCNCDAQPVGPCFKYDGSGDIWNGACAPFRLQSPIILSPIYVANSFTGSQCIWRCSNQGGVSAELTLADPVTWRFRLSVDNFAHYIEYLASGANWACALTPANGGQMTINANTIGCASPPTTITLFPINGPQGYVLCGRTLCDASMPATIHGTFKAAQCPDLDGLTVTLQDNGAAFPQRVWSGSAILPHTSQATLSNQLLCQIIYTQYTTGAATCYGSTLLLSAPDVPGCSFTAPPIAPADDCASLSCSPLIIKFLNFLVNKDPTDAGRQCPSCFTGNFATVDSFIVTL